MTQKTDTPKKAGRPKGTRNKSLLMQAQLLIDGASLTAVGNLIALADNNKEHFDFSNDIPATIVLAANKTILDKAIANEKEKDVAEKKPEKSSVTSASPRVFSSAK